MNKILLKPLITEKSVKNTANDKFTFVVSKFARKEEIKAIVEKLFGVNVLNIHTIFIKGEHKKNLRTGTYYTKKHVKKAIVKLKKGQKIDLFDTTSEETK